MRKVDEENVRDQLHIRIRNAYLMIIGLITLFVLTMLGLYLTIDKVYSPVKAMVFTIIIIGFFVFLLVELIGNLRDSKEILELLDDYSLEEDGEKKELKFTKLLATVTVKMRSILKFFHNPFEDKDVR